MEKGIALPGARSGRQLRWDAVVVLLVAGAVVVGHWSGVEILLSKWSLLDQAYSHGFVVLAIAAWLIWRLLRRERFHPAPSMVGVALVVVGSLAMAIAQAVGLAILLELGVVCLFWAGVFAVLGWRAAWRFAFPIGFLLFAVPFWDYLGYPLQVITVAVNQFLLGFWDIRFSVSGTYIHLQDVGVIHVANGCSGQRYLVVSLTLGALMAYLNLSNWRSRAVLLAVAAAAGLLTNWLRVFIIILVAYDSVMQSPLIGDHETFGWILFIVFLVPLIYIANRLVGAEARRRASANSAAGPPSGQWVGTASVGGVGLVVLAVCAAVLLPPWYVAAADSPRASALSLQTPESLGSLDAVQAPSLFLWQPQWHGADARLHQVYGAKGRPDAADPRRVVLGVWFYAHQAQGKELIHSANRLFDPGAWRAGSPTRPDGDATPFEYLVLKHRYSDRRVAVAYAFHVAGEWTSSRIAAKAYQVLGLFNGNRAAALVTLSANCRADCGRELPWLEDGAAALLAGEQAATPWGAMGGGGPAAH